MRLHADDATTGSSFEAVVRTRVGVGDPVSRVFVLPVERMA
ncbi:MAG: hypothetical protein ACKOC6_04425 [bacterium]